MYIGEFSYNDSKYATDEDGHILKNGWNKVNEAWYCVKSDRTLYADGFYKIDGAEFAFNKNGRMYIGEFSYNDSKYVTDEDGHIQKNGWKSVNNNWYFADDQGKLICNRWYKENSKWYYAKNSGAFAKNESLNISGTIYYFNNSCENISKEEYDETVNSQSNIIEIAKNEIGTKIGKKYWESVFGSSYAYSNGDSTPWCACFVKWCFDKAGQADRLKGVSNKAYVPSYTAWGNRNNLWTKNPSPGDIIIFRYSASSTGSHIGFVESVRGNTITTVEGNTGTSYHGEVKRNTYNINSSYIYGFIHY